MVIASVLLKGFEIKLHKLAVDKYQIKIYDKEGIFEGSINTCNHNEAILRFIEVVEDNAKE